MEKLDNREALDVASLAGDILLASGAEIFRVEETIFRIARAYGVESSDAFVLSSGIFLTAGSEKEEDFARVRHIPLSAARLDKVTAVNQLSREIVEGMHTPAEARERLLEIRNMPPKPRSHQVLASGIGSACFCFLFGGDPVDSLAAFAAGIVLYLYLVRGRLSKIAANLSGGALVTLFGILLYQCGIGHHLGEMIIGSIIPLVPGVAFTTAIRDIADEDYIAGAVRMLDALLVTFCIAMGVGLVIMAWHHFAGGTLL
ncbi:MAG TPA: threonine/serine exporter family protein [Candidatus Fusicatenibacter merdavium]|uniref:Threonine/serine exporter family protein n=1 Tax=Candidatus Fusicatenibacter merdavium TaxID=2838600 RepID=A0A9D1XBG6_9FIRM|nr:threonine/serine exporter family protein [Candidatus Fusicatenibacter merdavium]